MKTRPQKKTLTTNLNFKSVSPKHSATPGHILVLPKIKWSREILRLTNFSQNMQTLKLKLVNPHYKELFTTGCFKTYIPKVAN